MRTGTDTVTDLDLATGTNTNTDRINDTDTDICVCVVVRIAPLLMQTDLALWGVMVHASVRRKIQLITSSPGRSVSQELTLFLM